MMRIVLLHLSLAALLAAMALAAPRAEGVAVIRGAGAIGVAGAAAAAASAPAATGVCATAIAQAEQAGDIPAGLLAAISLRESGRRDPDSGEFLAWPWTINAEGEGFFFASKAEAIAKVEALQADGMRSIDVGCMQVNLRYHPDAFDSLEDAFDPATNAAYAADLLTRLAAARGGWHTAVGYYHSATPEYRDAYRERVLALWSQHGGDMAVLLAAAVPAAPGGDVPMAVAGRVLVEGLDGTRAGGIGPLVIIDVEQAIATNGSLVRVSAAPLLAPLTEVVVAGGIATVRGEVADTAGLRFYNLNR
jgi:hypothetical protein